MSLCHVACPRWHPFYDCDLSMIVALPRGMSMLTSHSTIVALPHSLFMMASLSRSWPIHNRCFATWPVHIGTRSMIVALSHDMSTLAPLPRLRVIHDCCLATWTIHADTPFYNCGSSPRLSPGYVAPPCLNLRVYPIMQLWPLPTIPRACTVRLLSPSIVALAHNDHSSASPG